MNRQLRALALSPFVRQRLTMFIAKQRTQRPRHGSPSSSRPASVTPSVDRTYPLHEAADAMRHLEAGHARGKVAISI